MKKKLWMLLLAGAVMIGAAGCSKDESGKYAMIVNNTTTENQSCTDAVWTGVKSYAESVDAGAQRYTAKGNERKDYAEAIEEAVDNGAKIIVCVGEEMEVPVYEAQVDFQNVKFILINGEPHKRYSEKTNIKENTISLYFNETEQGFIAGYTAVMSGYRNIGCMGGTETETNLKVAAGFVQGVEAAGKELALEEGDIQLHYTFTGVNKLSPVYMNDALEWYKDGCEMIFALDEGIRLSVVEAAKIQTGMVMSTDEESLEESELILTAAVIDYAGAVVKQMELCDADTFVGAQVVNCGIKEEGVALITENRNLSDTVIQQYNTVCQKLSEGTLKVEETMVVPATTITVVTKE